MNGIININISFRDTLIAKKNCLSGRGIKLCIKKVRIIVNISFIGAEAISLKSMRIFVPVHFSLINLAQRRTQELSID